MESEKVRQCAFGLFLRKTNTLCKTALPRNRNRTARNIRTQNAEKPTNECDLSEFSRLEAHEYRANAISRSSGSETKYGGAFINFVISTRTGFLFCSSHRVILRVFHCALYRTTLARSIKNVGKT